MIRKGREKGFRRRLTGALAGSLLLAALAAGSGPGEGPAGWEVRLSVAAKGAYTIRGGGAPSISGEYTLRARYEGRLDPDGEDFLLIHLRTETPEWSLREEAGRGPAKSLLAAPAAHGPVLRLRYVLRDKDHIEFAFAFDGGTVPLHAPALGIPLELPCSADGAALNRPGYMDDVLVGSNRIVLPASDLLHRRPERTFAWTWTGTKRTETGSYTYITVQSHSAEAVVGLVRR
jgi:hypothetical protein